MPRTRLSPWFAIAIGGTLMATLMTGVAWYWLVRRRGVEGTHSRDMVFDTDAPPVHLPNAHEVAEQLRKNTSTS